MGWMPIILAAGGTLVKGFGDYQQMNAQAKAYQSNANAVLNANQIEVARMRENGLRLAAKQRAAAGASGYTQNSLSLLAVMEDTRQQVEQDISYSRYNAEVKASQLRNQASIYKSGAGNALLSSFLIAGAKGYSAASQPQAGKEVTFSKSKGYGGYSRQEFETFL